MVELGQEDGGELKCPGEDSVADSVAEYMVSYSAFGWDFWRVR